jgi:putative tryptophan/tyrosine transport system substrate-binding protein
MLSLALLAALHVGDGIAQTMPVLGYVAAKNVNPERLEIFKKGLTDLGYVDGKNIRIEYRDAVLDAEYRGLMADLTNRKVDIIVAANIAGAVAAAKATNTIPVVMLAVNDPVAVGVVNSLENPGTNITGTTTYSPKLMGECLGYLRASCPTWTKSQWCLTATMRITRPSLNCFVQKPAAWASKFSP